MNSSLVVPSLFARATVERQQVEFTDGWDPLFIRYTAAVYFHTCDIKINSWTTQAKKMRGSMPPKLEVREILRTLDQASLENASPIQHVARDNSGLSLARRKDATCFLRWIMSVMTNSTVQVCHQKAMGSKTMERRVSTVILNVYQSTGIEKEAIPRESWET